MYINVTSNVIVYETADSSHSLDLCSVDLVQPVRVRRGIV